MPESDFTERIHEQVDRHLRQEDWRVEYMTWAMELMDIKDEMREELREEIREEIREELREEVKHEVRKEVKAETARKDAEIAELKALLAQAGISIQSSEK